MKIVSRSTSEEAKLSKLRSIIKTMSGGLISETSEVPLGTNLSELVNQLQVCSEVTLDTIDTLQKRVNVLGIDNLRLTNHIAQEGRSLNGLKKAIADGVEYDEALDAAVHDAMEAFIASGAAEPTFDGEISFDEDVTISRCDLKPIIREALESWIRAKVR